MPIDVDEVQRRKEIAEATLAVAARDGARAVTIRAVAKELGGSTAMVTNYVPTRMALITNAVRAAESRWRADLDAHVGELRGKERLRATVEWHLSTDPRTCCCAPCGSRCSPRPTPTRARWTGRNPTSHAGSSTTRPPPPASPTPNWRPTSSPC
ncbi:hypothetical protein DN402_04540 [Streptomyces sp. SW4]|nr:hypothetical protein DN402_04540 [Streptomyces sp. SW4]